MNGKVPIQDLSDEALGYRMTGLALNLYYDNRRLMLPADVGDLFRETLEECTRRGLKQVLSVPACIHEDDASPKIYSTHLIRYGKRNHLEKLMQGIISFGPSQLYKDASIEAQQDDEMQRRALAPNQNVIIGDVEYPASNIVLRSQIAEHDGTPIHYHLFCTAYEESQKLRRAFQADGFVRIRDYKRFFTLLEQELERTFPQAAARGSEVRYYDDREGHNSKTLEDIIFAKTVDYIYQREYRIALLGAPKAKERFEIQVPVPEELLELVLTVTY